MIGEAMPIGRLLDEAARAARVHFRRVVPPVAIPVALVAGLAPAAQLLLQRMGRRDPALGAALGIGLVAVTLVSLLLYMLAHGALMSAAVNAVAGRPVSMRQAWLTMLRPRVFSTGVLATLGIVAGMFCCVVPGLYLALLWSVMMPVMLEEGRFGPSALARSAELMRFNPAGDFGNDPRFHAFLVLFVGALLGYAVAFVVQMPLMGAMMVAMLRSVATGGKVDPEELTGTLLWVQIPTQMLGTAVNMAVQLFTALALSILFFDVRRRKEGEDLAAAVDRLAGSEEGAAPPPAP